MLGYALAEYTLAACNYFAKRMDDLKRFQNEYKWQPMVMSELRDSTFGILGYGDIGIL